jgi:hypothetical protein
VKIPDIGKKNHPKSGNSRVCEGFSQVFPDPKVGSDWIWTHLFYLYIGDLKPEDAHPLSFRTVEYDTTNSLDPTTSTFTSPLAGIYRFHACVLTFVPPKGYVHLALAKQGVPVEAANVWLPEDGNSANGASPKAIKSIGKQNKPKWLETLWTNDLKHFEQMTWNTLNKWLETLWTYREENGYSVDWSPFMKYAYMRRRNNESWPSQRRIDAISSR